jgi:hypothetical protein
MVLPNSDDLQVWINTFIIIAGFTTVGTIIYRVSQKFSITESRLIEHEKEILHIHKRIDEAKLEQKQIQLEEKDSLNTRLSDIRTDSAKEIENEKLNHKDIYAQIATVSEQVTINKTVQESTAKIVDDNHKFFTDWIQRIEDRIFSYLSNVKVNVTNHKD